MLINSSIGVLGGTFDPIHFAHLRLAEEVIEEFALDSVRLIPSADPPHRETPGASAIDRMRMVELATSSNQALIPDNRELKRSGKSYMVDTLKSLRAEYPSASISLILGTDAFVELESWDRWHQLFSLAHIIVAARPTVPIAKLDNSLKGSLKAEFHHRLSRNHSDIQSSYSGCVFTYDFTSLAVSGTSLREQIHSDRSLRYLMPDNVIDYISDHQLYRRSDSESGT